MMICAVRAVNTMGGLQTFSIAIICSGEEILSIKDSFTQCGVLNCELAFIHYSNETKGRCVAFPLKVSMYIALIINEHRPFLIP